jgi:hypothetical protein
MGQTGCPETSVHNYNWTLCNIPEERGPHIFIYPENTVQKRTFTAILSTNLIYLLHLKSVLWFMSLLGKAKNVWNYTSIPKELHTNQFTLPLAS